MHSQEPGVSWHPLVEGLTQYYGWSVVCDPGEEGTLLLSASVGPLHAHQPAFFASQLFRKQGQDAWQPVASEGVPEPEGTSRFALATRQEEAGVFYAATGRGVSRSQDGGTTWERLFALPARFHFKRVVALALWRKA